MSKSEQNHFIKCILLRVKPFLHYFIHSMVIKEKYKESFKTLKFFNFMNVKINN
jgi:hypothetical protein